jgi:fibronectin type 3 domain-containing protein
LLNTASTTRPGSTSLVDSTGAQPATSNSIILGNYGPFEGAHNGIFDGTSSYASLASNPLSSSSSFSAEAWLRWGDIEAGYQLYGGPIFQFAGGTQSYMELMAAYPKAITFSVQSAGSLFQISSSRVSGPINQAHYVAITESSGTLTLYIDGVAVATQTGVTATPLSVGETTDNWIGRDVSSYFGGSLSNVAFYTRALSAAQVKAHWNAANFPVNWSLPQISGTATDGQTLTAIIGGWDAYDYRLDGDFDYAYRWQRCDSQGANCTDIAGATSSSYAVTSPDVGSTLQVKVTATNGAGSSTATSAPTAAIQGTAPQNTMPPAISGTATDGQTLTADKGSWSGSTPIDSGYRWQRCDAGGSNCADIDGATASSYVLTSADVGQQLQVTVTGTNSVGNSTATSELTAAIAAAPPQNTAAPTSSGTATDGQTLTADKGTWSGTTPIDYHYQWQRCDASGASCSAIATATGSSYTLADDDRGATLRVEVTATNSGGSASASSAQTAVVPTDTTAPTTTITSGPSGVDDGQSASFTFTADDSGATIKCELDYGAWEPCASPVSLPGLANGRHTFAVRATDQVGNVEPAGPTRAWDIEPGIPAGLVPGLNKTVDGNVWAYRAQDGYWRAYNDDTGAIAAYVGSGPPTTTAAAPGLVSGTLEHVETSYGARDAARAMPDGLQDPVPAIDGLSTATDEAAANVRRGVITLLTDSAEVAPLEGLGVVTLQAGVTVLTVKVVSAWAEKLFKVEVPAETGGPGGHWSTMRWCHDTSAIDTGGPDFDACPGGAIYTNAPVSGWYFKDDRTDFPWVASWRFTIDGGTEVPENNCAGDFVDAALPAGSTVVTYRGRVANSCLPPGSSTWVNSYAQYVVKPANDGDLPTDANGASADYTLQAQAPQSDQDLRDETLKGIGDADNNDAINYILSQSEFPFGSTGGDTPADPTQSVDVVVAQMKTNNPTLTDELTDTQIVDIADECVELATQAGENIRDCGQAGLPIFVAGRKYPQATDHIVRAMQYGFEHGANWFRLTYKNVPVRSQWYQSQPETDGGAQYCVGTVGVSDCDEWPWQATEQGGPDASPRPHLKLIDLTQNRGSGGDYGRFVTACGLAQRKLAPDPAYGGGNFLVVPLPGDLDGVPTTFICNGPNPG